MNEVAARSKVNCPPLLCKLFWLNCEDYLGWTQQERLANYITIVQTVYQAGSSWEGASHFFA